MKVTHPFPPGAGQDASGGSGLSALLRENLGRYRALLVAVVVLQFVQTIASLYLPTLNADLIDRGIADGDRRYILVTGGYMLAVTVIQIAFAIGAVYFGARAAMAFGRDLRRNLFHRVTGFSDHEIDKFGAPSLITRITNDVQQVQMLVLLSCTLLAAAPITMVGGVVLALRQDVGLSALLLVSIPALVAGVGVVIVRLLPVFRAMQLRLDAVNRVLREQLMGIRVVRAFTREPDETTRFRGTNDALTVTSLQAGRLMALISPAVLLVLNLSSAAALWLGAGRIDDGELQIGELIAFLSYLIQILTAVMMATFMAIMVPRAAVSARRIQQVLLTRNSIAVADEPIGELPDAAGVLELRGVGFHYPGAEEPVLTGISLLAEPGRTTAIIGSTGAGKSTLINLVPRLFDITAGSVLVDGVDVRDLQPELLWRQIGLVPQQPYLFSGTVASNLRHANPEATDDELWAALGIAQATAFVEAMPNGLDTVIAQGGTNVSGGQRQRLAIARAVVRRPRIYLFDDSFSALDLATDARVRAALRTHTADATVLIVGQRVSSIMDADQILVLEDGHQVGLGTHRQLLESCPTYVEIVASQATEEAA
jgi:ATP-binding cassette, subfamily B, multidrug efflux pump